MNTEMAPSNDPREKLKQLREMASSMNALYVEDETDIREIVGEGFLKRIFREVLIATNGREGLEVFARYSPDIVISDIRMPEMDGLEMTKRIHEKDADVPVIITTAFGEQEFFLESIEAGVDQYLIKPINEKALIGALFKVVSALTDHRRSIELAKIEQQRLINKNVEDAMTGLSDSLIAPLAIYKKNELFYINEALRMILPSKVLEKLEKKEAGLECAFVKKKGYEDSLETLYENPELPAKVMIRGEKSHSIFLLYLRSMPDVPLEDEMRMVVFYDITAHEKQRLMIEYQKNKIANYNEMLEDMLVAKFFHRSTQEEKPIAAPQDDKPLETKSYAVEAILSEDEREILRRSHKVKSTAAEYVKELDQSTFEEIMVLGEIERDMSDGLEDFISELGKSQLDALAHSLHEYAGSLKLLIEFQDLSNALYSLCSFFQGLGEDEVINENTKIIIFLQNILADLSEWRNRIFVVQDAKDIHYLDSSLFSSCIQMQLQLSSQSVDDSEENDLELF